MKISLVRRVVAEFFGTAFLVAAIIGSGIMADRCLLIHYGAICRGMRCNVAVQMACAQHSGNRRAYSS